jgi:branched-chain amino acid transport system substrate-binding protein
MKLPAAAFATRLPLLRPLLFLLPLLALMPASIRAQSLPASTSTTSKIVTIGFAGPLSGDSASIGQSMEHAVALALTEANARKMRIDGKQIVFRLLAQDDQGNQRTASRVADYLVKAGAVAVIGHWHSTASISAAPVYHAAGIPQISPGSSNLQLTSRGYRNVFRVVGNDDDISRCSAQFVQQTLHAKRVAVINDDTIYGTMLTTLFSQHLNPEQSSIVARHTVSSKTSDFNHALQDLQAKHPDIIFFGGLMAQAAALQLNLKRTRINANMIAAGGIVSPTYLNLTRVNASSDGTFGIATGLPQERMNGWHKFRDSFVATYDEPIDYYAPFAYDAANIVLTAIRQAGSVAPAALTQALHSIKYQGLTGLISFDAQGNLNNPNYTVFQVKGGEWLPVQSFSSK